MSLVMLEVSIGPGSQLIKAPLMCLADREQIARGL